MLSFLISSVQVVYFQTVRSHSQMFFKIGVRKSFVKLTGKHLCRSLSLITLQHAAFFKTRLRHCSFIVNFANFLKTIFLQNNFGRLHTIFAISINLILFSQCGSSRNKSLEAVVLRCSSNFRKKTCVEISFYFDKFAFLKRPITLLKKDSNSGVFL